MIVCVCWYAYKRVSQYVCKFYISCNLFLCVHVCVHLLHMRYETILDDRKEYTFCNIIVITVTIHYSHGQEY